MIEVPTYWLAAALAAVALVTVTMAFRAWLLPRFPGQQAFVLMLLAMASWAGAVACEHGSAQVPTKVFWAEMASLGIAATPGCWLLFTWNDIYGLRRPAPPALYWAVLAEALAASAVALTNGRHRLLDVRSMRPTTRPLRR